MWKDLKSLCTNLIDILINALRKYLVSTNNFTCGNLDYNQPIDNYCNEFYL